MVTLRGLVFLIPALLIGCGTGCPPMGKLSGTLQQCSYLVHVIDVNHAKKEVTAVTHPKRVMENEEYDYYGGPKGDQFIINVHNFDILAAPGGPLQAQPLSTPNPKLYVFTGTSDSVTFELLPDATVAKLLNEKKFENFKY